MNIVIKKNILKLMEMSKNSLNGDGLQLKSLDINSLLCKPWSNWSKCLIDREATREKGGVSCHHE